MNFEMETAPHRQVYNLLIGLIAPRPIAWITSMDREGKLNAAPFSAFNYLCTDPPVVGIGVTNRPDSDFVPKDTAQNTSGSDPGGVSQGNVPRNDSNEVDSTSNSDRNENSDKDNGG